MRWKDRRASTNVEDRRGLSAKRGMVGGGIGTIVIVLAVYFLGGDPSQVLNTMQQMQGEQSTTPYVPTAEEEELAQFVSVVLAETEDVWTQLFREMGKEYQLPKLVLFTDSVQSACGFAGAATGPFYCPGDNKVYIDLAFYRELQEKFQAPGDFAMAYVIAHEIGHHVQTLLGISPRVRGRMQEVSEKEANALSVAMELQADFLAGVWAYHTDRYKGVLEAGDIDEALSAASAVGDDRIQKKSQGYTVPDSFTHGTSEQRMYWFKRGYASGDLRDGNTFAEMGLSL